LLNNIQTSPPTLFLEELLINNLPTYKLVKLVGNNENEFVVGELFNDSNLDDLIEMGFDIKINT